MNPETSCWSSSFMTMILMLHILFLLSIASLLLQSCAFTDIMIMLFDIEWISLTLTPFHYVPWSFTSSLCMISSHMAFITIAIISFILLRSSDTHMLWYNSGHLQLFSLYILFFIPIPCMPWTTVVMHWKLELFIHCIDNSLALSLFVFTAILWWLFFIFNP